MTNDKLIESYLNKIIDERYKILEAIGFGGMSVVFKAQDMLMNRYVALKVLNEELDTNEKAVRRFANESKAVAMVSSSNIVKIYDVNLDHTPKYIAMEYVNGITLKEFLEKNAPLSCEQAVNLTTQLLNALRRAHEKHIIHRDVKPQNVMVTPDLRLKLTDFGIAKLPDSEWLEEDEKAMGTVHYISPEQASGKDADFYTDVYSAGVIFYEMLTGKLPFEGSSPLSVAMMHVNNQPVMPRKLNAQIPAALEQIIMKSMAKAPADRFHSAAGMNRALKLYAKDNGIIFEKETLEAVDQTAVTEKEKPKKEPAPKPKKEKVKHGRRTMFPIIFGVSCAFMVVFLFAAGILLFSLMNMTKDTSLTITVPDLVGQIYSSEFAKRLEDDNVKVASIEYVYDADSPSGTIVSQTPEAGQRKKLKDSSHFCEVSLKISRGNETVIVPDIAVQEYRNAIITLQEAQLEYKIVQSFSNTILDGYVISTEPAAGSVVAKNTLVTVYVSLGQEITYTAMPDLSGKTLNEAKKILAENSLVLGNVVREPSEFATGTVLRQSIDPGRSVPKKYTTVDLVLSIKIPPTTIPPTQVPPATTSEAPVSSSSGATTQAPAQSTGTDNSSTPPTSSSVPYSTSAIDSTGTPASTTISATSGQDLALYSQPAVTSSVNQG